MAPTNDSASLTVRRGQLKATLTRFVTFIHGETIDKYQLRIRREKLEDTWNEFQQVQSAMEDEADEVKNNNENFPYRIEFEDTYFKAVAEAEKVLNPIIQQGLVQTAQNTGTTSTQSTINLAALNIPTFSGKYEDWSAFFDMFQRLVHFNAEITPVQKFFYLKSSLNGEAASSIRCIETTDANYEAAWTTLIERYNNKKVLVQRHVRNIVELEPLQDSTARRLRMLIDDLNGNMKALETLGEKPGDWGPLLLHIVCSKLDRETLKSWEIKSSKDKVPTVKELTTFLGERFQIMESIESSQCSNNYLSTVDRKSSFIKHVNNHRKLTTRSNTLITTAIKCYVCNQPHTIYKCPSFIALSVAERISKVNTIGLCKICLRKHDKIKCFGKYCLKCNNPHNTLLHLNKSVVSNRPETQTENNSSETATTISTTAHVSNTLDQVLLATALVQVSNSIGQTSVARVLLDSASMNNFITVELANSLRLKRQKINHMVCGIGQTTQSISSTVELKIKSRNSDFQLFTRLLVVPKITGELPMKKIRDDKNTPAGVTLADPLYNVPQPVDILIGASHFFNLIGKKQFKSADKGLIYQETEFGFVVSGAIPSTSILNKSTSCVVSVDDSINGGVLENLIQQFWHIEECNFVVPYTAEEKACKKIFEKTVIRDVTGRFMVHLPFKENVNQLGESYEIAKRRLLSMEKRFRRDPGLKRRYVQFMREYENLNHMEKVVVKSTDVPGKICYLPHHGVYNENSITTKLRVVFDASTKTESGISLNDTLLKGPTVQEDLIYILTRFRTHNYVLTADIKKMYRQILVVNKHRDYQRILWREEENEPISVYRLNTLSYGTVPASYIATGCLKILSITEQNRFPSAAAAIGRDFYMDDFLSGDVSQAATAELRDGIIKILSAAGLELGKWSSNESSLINSVNGIENNLNQLPDINNSITKILGLCWDSHKDMLQYKIEINKNLTAEILSKRNILSEIARIYDPLGLIGPIIIKAKLILQSLWKERITWNEPVSDIIRKEWLNYKTDLNALNDLKIPRQITIKNRMVNIEVHGFADASINAYGCCLYLRCSDEYGNNYSNLISAKSKVAPLKELSLPRLELCAAVLLARLGDKIIPKLLLPINKKFYWSDSKVVLCWISSLSRQWKTFIAHRVGEIQELTAPSDWYHVNSKDNPADIISRGCRVSELNAMSLWWHGPSWLLLNEKEWPNTTKGEIVSNLEEMPEFKSSISAVCSTDEEFQLISKFSSFNKLLRVVAYCLRFKNNALDNFYKKKNVFHTSKRNGFVSAIERNAARLCLVKLVQGRSFLSEIIQLKKGKEISKASKLYRLRPFLDENNLLRVGGRLKNADDISVFQRNPMVLPSHCSFTKLLFREEHIKLMHSGPQALLASVRLNYWPINGRNLARFTVNRCVVCFRHKPQVVQPIMGDLPRDRLSPGRAFLATGIDFCGPFLLKTGLRKNSPVTKAYVCIFICFATHAVHFELVSDLSTEAFLRALNRFFDRRGKSKTLYSDNASNFIGSNRQLKEWYELSQTEEHQSKINNMLSENEVEWKFIPARSPHFGGLWEAGVKSMKYLLRRVLGDAHLFYEELLTVITRVEACLNSRPLTILSSDPSDLSPLTPGHFLIGNSLTALPELDQTNISSNRLTRWRRVSQYSQNLWKRWSREYLAQLQERTKRVGEKGPKIKVDTIVLLKDDNIPSLKWRLGRVVNVVTGNDGVIRVADVKTMNGSFRRGVRFLCPLPIDEN